MKKLVDVYRVDNFIDTFALGHYARVLEAHDRRNGQTVAFKVMRPEHLSDDGEPSWEYRAFANEAELLMKLADSPHTVNLLDCGFVSTPTEAPISGEIDSFGHDVIGFSRSLDEYCQKGWRPYLALENLPRGENLFYQMRPDKAGLRLRLPTEEGLALAVQFTETLKLAHENRIAYLDHKLEHLYWDGIHLRLIDFNSSRLIDNKQPDGAQLFCNDIHNMCVGILYSIFTGLSPQKTALRPQPGSLTDVEARYQDVNSLDFGIEPTLSPALQDLLQRGATRQVTTAQDFLDELHNIASLHGWDFPGHYTSPISRDARTQMRAGITKMRKGQDALREARDLFREAAIQDGITDDLEAELRRLVKSVNDMLQNRVIP